MDDIHFIQGNYYYLQLVKLAPDQAYQSWQTGA
jgi:hypothetical protein